jgi:hypothetical protein
VNKADRQEVAALVKQHIDSQGKINKGIIKQLNEIAGSQEEILKGFQSLNEIVQRIAADLTAIVGAELAKAHNRARKAGATEPKKQKPTGARKKREAT